MTHDEADTEQDKLLGLAPKELWALDSTDIGRIHSASPIKITIGKDKPLPSIHQYLLRQEAIEGIKPLISAYIEEGLIVPCTSPCKIPILPVKKPDGKGWSLVQDFRFINAIIIPSFFSVKPPFLTALYP